MEFCSCARGRQWCGIIHYHWWTASIKPRLLFSRAGYASWELSLSSVKFFLDHVEQGDDILADRGFNIEHLLLPKKQLNIPAFSHGKCLSSEALKRSRSIVSVRFHVERAMRRIKTLKVISGSIPLKFIFCYTKLQPLMLFSVTCSRVLHSILIFTGTCWHNVAHMFVLVIVIFWIIPLVEYTILQLSSKLMYLSPQQSFSYSN